MKNMKFMKFQTQFIIGFSFKFTSFMKFHTFFNVYEISCNILYETFIHTRNLRNFMKYYESFWNFHETFTNIWNFTYFMKFAQFHEIYIVSWNFVKFHCYVKYAISWNYIFTIECNSKTFWNFMKVSETSWNHMNCMNYMKFHPSYVNVWSLPVYVLNPIYNV